MRCACVVIELLHHVRGELQAVLLHAADIRDRADLATRDLTRPLDDKPAIKTDEKKEEPKPEAPKPER